MISSIESVTFRKLLIFYLSLHGGRVLVVISHNRTSLFGKIDLIFRHDKWITLWIPENHIRIFYLKYLELRVLYNIPNGNGLSIELLSFIICIGKMFNYNSYEFWVTARPDFAYLTI